MEKTLRYLQETLGVKTTATNLAKSNMDMLPIYIKETYNLFITQLFNTQIVLAELKNEAELSVQQTGKQVQIIRNFLNKMVVVILENVPAYNRKRLIEKGINFIVPGKQLYLPELLVDLREIYTDSRAKQKRENLLPSAQFMLIYHLNHRTNNWKIEGHSFKEIAQKLGYTPMAITNAVENLKYHELVEVQGEKEKFIRFRYNRNELWNVAHKKGILINPVIKTVFVDQKPKDLFLLKSNTSALPVYTDLNPSRQEYYAIEKTEFYGLQKSNVLENQNEHEGKYALEIWKYNPLTLLNELPINLIAVDPISLYLSLRESNDERIEMALEQILKNFIWSEG